MWERSYFREITGRLHRPSIIYIEEYPGYLPTFLHTSRPDRFLYKFWSVFKTRRGKGSFAFHEIRWAPSRGYISHRGTQIVQGVLQQLSHSQINIYYFLANSTLSQKEETLRWQGLYRTALTPFQIWWDWSLDFFLYVFFSRGATQYTYKYIYRRVLFSRQAGEEGAPLFRVSQILSLITPDYSIYMN